MRNTNEISMRILVGICSAYSFNVFNFHYNFSAKSIANIVNEVHTLTLLLLFTSFMFCACKCALWPIAEARSFSIQLQFE